MIKEIQLQNFKCFGLSPVFIFSRVNLLTGINGRGKSTVLQSLLLLCQSIRYNNSLKRMIINDLLVQLGNFDDIKNSGTPRGENIIKFHLKTDKKNIENIVFSFCENEVDSLVANTEEILVNGSEGHFEFGGEGILLRDKSGKHFSGGAILRNLLYHIHYVSADRLGPVKYVDKTNQDEIIYLDPKGEFTINLLANDNLPLVHEGIYIGNNAKTVIQQTQEWLNYILEGAKIEIKGRDKESSVLYMLMNNRDNSYNYKPANIGFGYSYILPLIVAGLIAKKDEILIVENPEAHLHPRAQSRLAEFFARVASTGVQVFIESHSEHILNGLRVCALNPEIDIKNTDLSILYFNESFEPEKLVIDEKGKIANWPEGFFDQQEIDLSSIFKFSR